MRRRRGNSIMLPRLLLYAIAKPSLLPFTFESRTATPSAPANGNCDEIRATPAHALPDRDRDAAKPAPFWMDGLECWTLKLPFRRRFLSFGLPARPPVCLSVCLRLVGSGTKAVCFRTVREALRCSKPRLNIVRQRAERTHD